MNATSRGSLLRVALAVTLVLVVASGCAHQPPVLLQGQPGFFRGLWHGLIVFFSLVGSIFTDVRIYAYPNSGFWYDAGFFLGASIALGGSARASCRRRRRD
jgi:hypothetical protein